MALADGPCAVNDGARAHARATAQSSTRNRPLCATRAREGLAVPAILPLLAGRFFSDAVPPFFREPQPKSAVTGTSGAASSFCKEGAR